MAWTGWYQWDIFRAWLGLNPELAGHTSTESGLPGRPQERGCPGQRKWQDTAAQVLSGTLGTSWSGLSEGKGKGRHGRPGSGRKARAACEGPWCQVRSCGSILFAHPRTPFPFCPPQCRHPGLGRRGRGREGRRLALSSSRSSLPVLFVYILY